MVVVVRVMVKDEGAGEMEEEVIVKEKVLRVVVRVMATDEGAGEREEGVTVKEKVVVRVVRVSGEVVMRVSGEGKARWVMMGEKEGDKKY